MAIRTHSAIAQSVSRRINGPVEIFGRDTRSFRLNQGECIRNAPFISRRARRAGGNIHH
jgi:hypothetical protein